MSDLSHNRLMPKLTFQNAEQTEAFAAAMGAWLLSLEQAINRGVTIGLCGTLGAGKTFFVQSMLAALGIDRAQITSPTFSLIQTYSINGSTQTPWVFHHLDAYRVRDLDEFLELGVEELFEMPKTICLIEWADKVADVLPEKTLWLDFEWLAESRRKIAIAGDETWREAVAKLCVRYQ